MLYIQIDKDRQKEIELRKETWSRKKSDLLNLRGAVGVSPLCPRDRLHKCLGGCGCGDWEGGAGMRGVGLKNREGDPGSGSEAHSLSVDQT